MTVSEESLLQRDRALLGDEALAEAAGTESRKGDDAVAIDVSDLNAARQVLCVADLSRLLIITWVSTSLGGQQSLSRSYMMHSEF